MKILHILLFVFSSLLLNAQIIQKTYTLTSPEVKSHRGYHILQFDNAMNTGLTGEPALPWFAVSLLLPPGHEAVSVEFHGSDEILLPGVYNIYPQQASRPLSENKSFTFSINEDLYESEANFPISPTGHLTTQYWHGHAFALTSFSPVIYHPSTGKVSYYQSVTITIHTQPSTVSQLALNNLKSDQRTSERITKFAQNPELLHMYPMTSRSNDDYEILIITPSFFASHFDNLIQFYLEQNLKGIVVTREFITSNMSGQDNAEKIRNYIIQEYQDHSIRFVILGGDVEHIPYRGFYCYAQSGAGYSDNNIPADLYYSALDGNWNTNGNSWWGEPGEDDLLPEVAVGRMPFSSVPELNNILHKITSYQASPVLGEFNEALLAGEWLYDDPETWGSDYLELLIGHRTDNGYETFGIPDTYNFERLYEELLPWGAADLAGAINSGKQYVHHVGHANYDYVAFMHISAITSTNFSQTNGVDHNYTIFHSHGCICGSFEESDCILERMVTISNFAVATIGNSRYGWFNEGQTEGPAAHLHREMMDAIYHEGLLHIGEAFVEMKIQTAPWVTAPGQFEEGALRWNFYDINILGDPVMKIWISEPTPIQVTYENELWTDDVSTPVNVSSGGLPLEDMLCVIMVDTVIHGLGITDNNGDVTIVFDEPFTASGSATLHVSGTNCIPASYPINLLAVSVDEHVSGGLNIYPNPAQNEIFIEIPESYLSPDAIISIHNQAGQLVYKQILVPELRVIDISHLPDGTYIVSYEGLSGKLNKVFSKTE